MSIVLGLCLYSPGSQSWVLFRSIIHACATRTHTHTFKSTFPRAGASRAEKLRAEAEKQSPKRKKLEPKLRAELSNSYESSRTELTKAKKKAHSRAYSKTKLDKLREGYGMDALTPFKL